MRIFCNQLSTIIGMLCVIMTITHSSNAASATKRALLIGIDDYQAEHISDLRGCGNDVDLMRSILINKFDVPPDNVKVLKDAQAKRQDIIDAIQKHLIAKAQADDVVILHYSGHGSQMLDTSKDEIDDYDETLVAHDSRTKGVFDISDDEINGLLKQLTEKTKNVTFIFDSCHSGAAARGGNAVRKIEPDNRPPPPAAPFAISARGAGDGEADFRLNGSDYVLISGCMATELSNEAIFNGGRQGVMTWYLSQALLAAKDKSTYKSVIDEVTSEVSTRYTSQHPQIEGPGTNLRVFGSDRISPWPYVHVDSVDGQKVKIEGGRIYGLGEDSVLDVYPPGTVDFESTVPVAKIKVIDVQDFSADAVVQDGGPVKPRSKVVLDMVNFGNVSVPVFIHNDGSESIKQIRNALAGFVALRLVDSETDARLIIGVEGLNISILNGDMESALSPVPLSAKDHVQKVVEQVKSLIHWIIVMDLKNPSSTIQIGFDIRRKDDPDGAPAPQEVASKTKLTYRVHNLDSVPLYVYVLDVSSDGSIEILYPRTAGAQEALPKGRILEKDILTFVPDGRSAVVDVFKVFATTRPIDPSVFPQGAIRRAVPSTALKSTQGPLEQFLSQAILGMRGSRPVEVKSWVTDQKTVTIRQPTVRFMGFSVHFDDAKTVRDLPSEFGLSRSTCLEVGELSSGDCFRGAKVSKEGTEWELIQDKATRGDIETLLSVGQAFDEAYQIQEQIPGAMRVEPLLEVEAPGMLDQHGIEKRDISSDDMHNDNARKDDQWHLKQIRAFEAWKKIRENRGVVEGAEADGLLIAHIDTGYRDHPETWKEVDNKRPIDPTRGYDYYDADKDPLDPLLDDDLLDNPGHGTASGSVIISPIGCQLEKAAGCVNGVARGAQLVPLRVHRTVSQFNTANLSRAIRDVANGDVSGQPKLVSIAMGGPPTMSMWKAVRKAEENGVLIVAAAGNYVRTVVWPARFSSTIGVAANNVSCHPWKHSSNGSKIDITSPGESVWRASLNKNHEYINGMGKGTTFATGNTSGAAGLWLAYHLDNSKLKDLQQQGKVTQAFRLALRESAWQPSADVISNREGTYCDISVWDTRNFGPGILDVAALLDVSLDLVSNRELLNDAEISDLPLFSSLYLEGTDPEKIRTDYKTLFGKTRTDVGRKLNNFETEILYHYTVNKNVRQTIDSLVEGQRGTEPFDRIRENLLKQDLSQSLRKMLTK